jgi:hypothetical protein
VHPSRLVPSRLRPVRTGDLSPFDHRARRCPRTRACATASRADEAFGAESRHCRLEDRSVLASHVFSGQGVVTGWAPLGPALRTSAPKVLTTVPSVTKLNRSGWPRTCGDPSVGGGIGTGRQICNACPTPPASSTRTLGTVDAILLASPEAGIPGGGTAPGLSDAARRPGPGGARAVRAARRGGRRGHARE